jgi:hypothetical protein
MEYSPSRRLAGCGAPVVFEGARQQAGEEVSLIIEPVILTNSAE